jgi:hypothetical protein
MNALVEGTYNRTLAFAPYAGLLDTSAATTPHADVFARRERQPIVFSSERQQNTVHILFGERRGTVTYPDRGTKPPPWVVPVLRSLVERWGVKSGWDSYDAKPTDTRHAARLLWYLFSLMDDNSAPPIMTPLSDGGVQATWHRNDKDLEVVVSADEKPTFYFHNGVTNNQEEEELEPNLAHVRVLIQEF